MNQNLFVGSLLTTTLLAALPLHATDRTWTGNTSTDFEVAGNWNTAVPANNTSSDKAIFGTSVTANQPALTTSRSINGLVFQSASGGWTLGGSGYTLTIGTGGVDDTANTSGTTTINADVKIGNNVPWNLGAGGSLVVNGTFTMLYQNNSLVVNSGQLTIPALVCATANSPESKTGAGTLAINGAAGANLSSFSVGAGKVLVGDKAALGTGALVMSGGAAAELRASTDLIGVNKLANSSLQMSDSRFGGAYSLEIGGKAARIHNASSSIYSNIAAGKRLILNDMDASSAVGAGSLTITIRGTGDTLVQGTVANGTASTAGLIKNDAGVLTLTGANTYNGNTTISGGTLVAGHTNACGTVGTITASSGATFAVACGVTFTRAVTFNNGSGLGGSGTLARGAAWSLPTSFAVRPGLAGAPGALTVDTAGGDLTFGNNTLEIDCDGTAVDRLTVAGGGALSLNGTTDTLVLRGTVAPGTYVLADASNLTGTFTTVDLDDLQGGGEVSYTATQVLLSVSSPGTVLLLR